MEPALQMLHWKAITQLGKRGEHPHSVFTTTWKKGETGADDSCARRIISSAGRSNCGQIVTQPPDPPLIIVLLRKDYLCSSLVGLRLIICDSDCFD